MDIEKIIKGLECHQIDNNHRINCADCPYYVDDCDHIRCVNDLHDDAIELLKPIKNNAVHLCNSCCKKGSDCDAENDDIILGNRCEDNNVCACEKYVPFAESDSQSCADMIMIPEETYYNILAMLKEQEAVKPKKADNPEESEYCCGICGYPLWLDELYCAHCGRRIEWKGQ